MNLFFQISSLFVVCQAHNIVKCKPGFEYNTDKRKCVITSDYGKKAYETVRNKHAARKKTVGKSKTPVKKKDPKKKSAKKQATKKTVANGDGGRGRGQVRRQGRVQGRGK